MSEAAVSLLPGAGRWVRILLLGIVLGIFRGAWAQGVSGDDAAVRAVVARYMKARNDKDSEAVKRLFTADADQLVSTGEWRRGLDQLVSGMAASSQKELGQSSITVESVRFLDGDVAMADGSYQTTSASGATRKMWTTLVLKRSAEGWHIAAIRNMLPSAPATGH